MKRQAFVRAALHVLYWWLSSECHSLNSSVLHVSFLYWIPCFSFSALLCQRYTAFSPLLASVLYSVLYKTFVAHLYKCSCWLLWEPDHPRNPSLKSFLCLYRSMFQLYFSSQRGLTFYHGGHQPTIDLSARAYTESPSSIWDNPYISIKMEWPKTHRQCLVGMARMLQWWL